MQNPETQEMSNTLVNKIEAVLFAVGDSVGIRRLAELLETSPEAVESAVSELASYYSYQQRGIRLVQMDDQVQLVSSPEFADLIRKAIEVRKPAVLSQPALEVLAIVAYNQPTTRIYIDQIRGVDSSYTVGLLVEKELIEECGRLEVPGRPILYRTTENFLRSFRLKSLDELPSVDLVYNESEVKPQENDNPEAQTDPTLGSES